MARTNETVFLHDVAGIARLHGEDTNGLQWLQWTMDELAEEEPGECDICGAEVTDGWVCMDGGAVVCGCHVDTEDDGLGSGYRPCACRDCMETAIGHRGALCHECESAGCIAGAEQECQSEGAYGGNPDEESNDGATDEE